MESGDGTVKLLGHDLPCKIRDMVEEERSVVWQKLVSSSDLP